MKRDRAVILRFLPEEYEAIAQAHDASQQAANHWDRIPLAAWMRRTLVNVAGPKAAPAKTKAKTRSRKRAA